MRRAVAILALTLVLPAGALAAGPEQPLGHEGRWITDASGRAVILHGVNMVYKRPPYHPGAIGFDGPDARFLHRHGFNTVRLGLIYKGVEPRPGRYDDRYLDQIARTERILARNGIFSLLDFHQDLYNEKFSGEGFPDWAVIDDGLPSDPKQPMVSFGATYFVSPGLNEAFNSFWLNRPGPGGIGLQDRYAAAWRHVAGRFRDQPRVLGYDLMNEPWPGSQWPTCTNAVGCPSFERQFLGPMEEKTIARIREADDSHIVWYEPSVTTQAGPKYWIPESGDPNAGMSFHVYCALTSGSPSDDVGGVGARVLLIETDCDMAEQRALDNAIERADANGDTLLLSEFGATDDPPTIKRMVDRADRGMVSWQWWHYCGCDDPTTSGAGDVQAIVKDPAQPPTGDNVIRDKLALIERPYPQAVAGTPTSYFYGRRANRFRLTYRTKAPSGMRLPRSVATRVYVPRIHYPDGYAVEVSGARVVSSPSARYLRLTRAPDARTVSVTVRPAPS